MVERLPGKSGEHNTWPMTGGVMATWEGRANSSWNGSGKLGRKGEGLVWSDPEKQLRGKQCSVL